LLDRVDAGKGAIRLSNDAEIMPDGPALFAQIQRYETWYQRKPGGWERTEAAQLAIAETGRAGSAWSL
jgi:hypothetical protein